MTRENESADLLAKAGFKVEQRPRVPGTTREPDFRIEGRIFDNYAPSTSSPRNIWAVINDTKVNPVGKHLQADRIVLNLRDSGVDLVALKRQFSAWPMPNLREVIVITREGSIVPFWP
ncbi:Annexin repeat-containing protein [Myxococcus stipitatus DSM 14675]|uniref:Annexin repeat-containing protein n=1 Tax=Myxococcus stipitatus (strain DSM 14675 / JCM 12634 / Mx s8) TaxID=1278073 RepID=L7U023_MYXSD|nr:Annexin repeat-containing protein [Myxococcus stipitatus]AGC41588.1 Annexin repeat-containing protein [Myxococcus stipitatus DSM 14675]